MSSIGGFLLVVVIGELLWFISAGVPFPGVFLLGILVSLPLAGGLFFGGFWLRRSELDPERYTRIGGWLLFGTANLTIVTGAVGIVTASSVLGLLAPVRWGIALGAGTGFLIGVFEAKAIQEAVNQERLKEVKQQNKRFEEFASFVSHDLRNPLNVAAGRLELARSECDSDHLDHVHQEHERMEELIEDLLAMARQGKPVTETASVDLAAVAKESWENVATAEASLSTDSRKTIQAEETRLKQLFENLFRNAIDHGPRDVSLTVGTMEGGFYVEGHLLRPKGRSLSVDSRSGRPYWVAGE